MECINEPSAGSPFLTSSVSICRTPANWPNNHEGIGKKGWAFLLPTVTPEASIPLLPFISFGNAWNACNTAAVLLIEACDCRMLKSISLAITRAKSLQASSTYAWLTHPFCRFFLVPAAAVNAVARIDARQSDSKFS